MSDKQVHTSFVVAESDLSAQAQQMNSLMAATAGEGDAAAVPGIILIARCSRNDDAARQMLGWVGSVSLSGSFINMRQTRPNGTSSSSRGSY